MEFDRIKKYLEKEDDEEGTKIDQLPFRVFDTFMIHGIRVHLAEAQPARALCSYKIPPRLVNTANNSLHEGAIATLVDVVGSAAIIAAGIRGVGVATQINISCVDASLPNEEIEIEAKEVRIGKTIAVVNVEIRKKATGTIIAQGRNIIYLPKTSKL